MFSLRVLALGALLLASPALAEDWRVESVSGDAVSTKANADPEPLDVGSVVADGATVVSGPQTSVRLRRGGDVVSFGSNAIVDFRSGGGARATVEPTVGDVEFDTTTSAQGPFVVVTKWFRVDAETASFAVKARKDAALLDVDGGVVDLHDTQRGGDSVQLRAGGSFRGAPLGKDADAKKDDKTDGDKAKGASGDPTDAEIDKAMNAVGKPAKPTKKQSELAKRLAARGGKAVKDGLDELADEYDGDPLPTEAPKIGILTFLFGKDAPNTGVVIAVIGVLFVGMGALTATLLRGVSFGMFGNAIILLVGAFLGAGLHDLACPPNLVWEYEPTPGIILTTLGAFGALVGACFLRRYIEDRMEQAEAVARATAKAAAPRRIR